MIKFRQKEFVAPVLGLLTSSGLGNALMAGSIIQGVGQAKKQAELEEEQAQRDAKMTKALNKIAENAKNNPVAMNEAASIMSQRQYAFINPNVVRNAKGFVKDVKPLLWNNGTKKFLANGALFGTSLGVASYVTDKAIQKDAKKIGMPLGNNEQEKQYALPASGSIMKGLKSAGKFIENNKGTVMMAGAMGSIPAISYLTERKEFKDQIKATEQKQFAFPAGAMKFMKRGASTVGKRAGSIWNSTKKSFKPIVDHPGKTILGGVNRMTSFGGFGWREVENFGKGLTAAGQKSGNAWTQKAGNFIVNNPKTALVGAIPVGMAATKVSYDLSEKAVRKGAEAVDKNAFAYEKSKNQVVQ